MDAIRTRVTFETVLSELRKRDFAVLSTADQEGRPHSVGVVYGVSPSGVDIYVMTRSHLKKARNIARNPNVSMVVPLSRRVLWFLPPPCIQFHGRAELLDRHDAVGTETFKTFFMGRRILTMYEDLEQRGDGRTCFIRITLDPVVSTYIVGHSIWELSRRMEVGTEQVAVPVDYCRSQPIASRMSLPSDGHGTVLHSLALAESHSAGQPSPAISPWSRGSGS